MCVVCACVFYSLSLCVVNFLLALLLPCTRVHRFRQTFPRLVFNWPNELLLVWGERRILYVSIYNIKPKSSSAVSSRRSCMALPRKHCFEHTESIIDRIHRHCYQYYYGFCVPYAPSLLSAEAVIHNLFRLNPLAHLHVVGMLRFVFLT